MEPVPVSSGSSAAKSGIGRGPVAWVGGLILLVLLAAAAPAGAANPTLVAAVPPTSTADSVSASVTIANGSNPTGTITFSLWAPDQTTCIGEGTVSSKPVNGPGPYSVTYTLFGADPGTYRWTFSYSGDANNTPASTACGAHNTQVGISPTEVIASATPSAETGEPISAEAYVDGLVPEGDLNFELYGPGDATCAGTPVYSHTETMAWGDENEAYLSGPYVPATAGTYRWVVSYDGDEYNAPSSTSCGESGMNTVVTGSPVDPCVLDPELPQCQEPDPCLANPNLPECQEPDLCAADPGLPQCQVCPAGSTGAWPYCERPKCPDGSTGEPPHCVRTDPCVVDPNAAGCKAGGQARLAVGTAQTGSKKIRRGGSVAVKVTVRNTGEATAAAVKACPSLPRKTRKSFKTSPRGCLSLGSIPAGTSKVAKVKVKATRRAKGKAKLTLKVTSGNAGGGTASITLGV